MSRVLGDVQRGYTKAIIVINKFTYQFQEKARQPGSNRSENGAHLKNRPGTAPEPLGNRSGTAREPLRNRPQVVAEQL